MSVKLELYRVFKEVAEAGNITAAAQALYISQSAVSQSIKQLEGELQTRLFARNSRGVALTPDGRMLYAITPKGLKNSAICESSLPYSVRLRTDRNIEEYNKELLRQAQVQGKAIPRENGTYTVELKLSDDVDSLMQLELMVATEEMAKDLAERFRKDPEHLYARVLEALYEEQK